MGEALIICWLALTIIVAVTLALAQRTLLARGHSDKRGVDGARGQRRAASTPIDVSPVSVLKPLCGADANLEANLTTLFRQDHPNYEVLLGAADADDPALDVARRVAAAHPNVPSQVIADARRVGLNPKVNNLSNLARHARHEVLVVSDSNVAAPPSYLADLAARLGEPGVGLVSSPFLARSPKAIWPVTSDTLGGALESLQLNTFVMGGVASLTLLGGVCCVGKSMAFRRADLDAIGGFEFLGQHLAEDQVAAMAFERAGHRVTVDATVVENVLGPLSVRAFCARHLRWARIRRWVAPAGYAAEVAANPVACSLAAFAVLPAGSAALCAAVAIGARALCDLAMERRLGVRRPLSTYAPLLVLKEALLLALWIVPFIDRRIVWRGKTFLIGPQTRIEDPAARAPTGFIVLPDLVLDGDATGDPIAATA